MADNIEPHVESTQEESPQERLKDLSARATALYAVKKYEEAAELYSEATEIQAELNGELAEENADLLFAYGRCLFFVAQKTSTVLGGTAASAQLKGADKKPSKKRRANGSIKPESSMNGRAAGPSAPLEPIAETSEPADVVPAEDVEPTKSQSTNADKPFFKIEGDAGEWADSSDEEEQDQGEGEEEEEEEEEDDFSTAFEILDIARILYTRKLERLEQAPPSQSQPDSLRDLKIRISDIYDLQAEISLEGEKFDAAVTDLRSCLGLKESLYSSDSSLLAECHYKLSLALEAASQVQQRDQDGNPVGEMSIDWHLRNEAVTQQEKAIESCKARVAREEKELEALPADKKAKAHEQIEDVKDMTSAMEQRLEELKKPPVSVKKEAEKDAQQELMGSVLGQLLGSGGAEQQKDKLAEIMASANDVSGMVKKKKRTAANGEGAGHGSSASTPQPEAHEKGKRKLDDQEGGTEKVKKVRVAHVAD